MIEAKKVSKVYSPPWWKGGEKVVALEEFDFQAKPFEVTGLVGANGAGKSTLFRLMTGLEGITQGDILLNGQSIKDKPNMVRGKISLLLEKHSFVHMKGINVLIDTGLMMGLCGKQAKQRADELVVALGMEGFINQKAHAYSRGQAGRLAIANMSMVETDVVIFDEPTVGLDFDSADIVRRFIRQSAKKGHTVVLSTHILRDIEMLCDQIVGIKHGKNAPLEEVEQWMKKAKLESVIEEGDTV